MPVISVNERENKLPVIKTHRLTLRDIQVEDISKEYIEWLNNPDVTQCLEIRFEKQTEEKVKQYIEAKLEDTRSSKHFGVYDTDGSRLVGTVTVTVINWNHSYAFLSFVIGHPDAQRKGYATEAVNAVMHYAFQYCGLKKLQASYYDGHVASARVLEKNGFTVEGRLRKKFVNSNNERVDHIFVGLLAEEYLPL